MSEYLPAVDEAIVPQLLPSLGVYGRLAMLIEESANGGVLPPKAEVPDYSPIDPAEHARVFFDGLRGTSMMHLTEDYDRTGEQ